MNKTDVLVYTGGATTRKMSAADWEGVGIKQADVVWNWKNKKRVEVKDLSDEAIDFLIENHPTEFRVVKAAEVKEQDAAAPSPRPTPAPNGN
jgi:hypothetical protein